MIELKLLPGSLNLNNSKKYICKNTVCELNDGSLTNLYIANSYGRYSHLNSLNYNVFLQYHEEITDYDNRIAGIYNNEKTFKDFCNSC